jgi:hypothetical protein
MSDACSLIRILDVASTTIPKLPLQLRAEALKAFEGSIPSRRQTFIHHDPRNFQPEPFRQFFDADGELLKLKARDFYD